MIDKIEEVIENKVKNLHPIVKKSVISELLRTNLNCKYKILQYIRKMLELPSSGSHTSIYWIKRGWSQEESEIKRIKRKMTTSPMIPENWLEKTNEKTGEKYTIEEAKHKIRSFRKVNKEYWMEKGYNESESIIKISEFQKENSNKLIEKILKNPEKYINRTETQLQYWIDKGYSNEIAKNILSKRQSINLDFFVEKYGDEVGIIKYNQRISQLSYTSSRNFYIDKYGVEIGNNKFNEILKKRLVKFNKSSKEAYYFLIPIYKYARNIGMDISDIYWGVGYSNEWFIRHKKSLFFYDFTIRKLNIIIEYHGDAFHPRTGDYQWISPFGVEYEKQIHIDNMKREIAEKNGFKYISVYGSDDINEKQDDIIKLIEKEVSTHEKNRR